MLRRSLLLAVFALSGASSAVAQFEDETTGPLTVDQFVERAQTRLKEHNYFSKILVGVDRSQPPLVLFLHKPQVEQADWDKRIVGSHAPWLVKLEEVFRKSYVEPLGWKRRDDTPAYAVCELQTQGDFINFLKTQTDPGFNAEFAQYDRRLRATVAYHEAGGAKAVDKRSGELAEFVRQLLAAYNGASKDPPPQAWLVEGLGAYLVEHTGDDPKALEQRRIDPKMVELLVRASQDAQQRDVYLLPIAELAATRGADQVWTWMAKRAERLNVELNRNRPWPAFYAQAALWMHYLHDGDDAKHRPALVKFLTSALAGNGGADALRAAFEPSVFTALDRGFYRWLYARYEATHAGEKLDPRWIDELFAARSGAAIASAAAAPSTSELRPARDDAAAEHGALLQMVRRGDLEVALAQLVDLELRARSGPFGRRIASDVERVKRLIALRDAYLAELITSGGKLECEYEGKKLSAKPLRVESGLIALGENRQKVASLPLSALDPLVVARAVPKSVIDSPDGWVRVYPYVLAGDARWKTLLKGDAPEVTALRNDALEWYPRVLEIGEAARSLIDLANAGAPADAQGAQRCLDAIVALRTRFGELQLVKDRTTGLGKLAAQALEKQFDPAKLASWLHGQVEVLGNGGVRVTYEFEREDEGKDLAFDAGYEAEWRKHMQSSGLNAPTSEFLVAGGTFQGGGSTCYRLPLAVEAPLTVTASVQFAAGADANSYASFVRIGAGDDGQGNFIASEGMGGLTVVDRSTGLVRSDFVTGGVTLDADRAYQIALSIDGKRATTTVDGQKVKELPCGSRKRGGTFFATYGNAAVSLHRLVIEGKLALEETRAQWVALRLAELGLAPQQR